MEADSTLWTTIITSAATTAVAMGTGFIGYLRFQREQSQQRESDCGKLMLDISRDLRSEIESLNELKSRLESTIDKLQHDKADLLSENVELKCSLRESNALVEELQRKISNLEKLVERLRKLHPVADAAEADSV